MNREIKFRGLRTDGNGWIYGFLFKDEGEYYIQKYHSALQYDSTVCEVEEKSIGQYTGVVDSNNREIYEGDIIKYYDNNTTEEVKFEIFDTEQGYFINTDYTREVIGNIHQP